MKTSETGFALIKAFESCLKQQADGTFTTYYCPAGKLTIGWGTTRDDVPTLKPGDSWSQATCDSVFAGSLAKYEAAVERATSPRVLNQNQYDALVSLVYNCGPDALAGAVGKAVREGRDDDVPAAIARWCHCNGEELPGLVRRRKAEGQLYAGDLAGASATTEEHIPGTMPQKVDRVSEKKPPALPNAFDPHGGDVVAGSLGVGVIAATHSAFAGQPAWLSGVACACIVVVGVTVYSMIRGKLKGA